MNEKSFAEVQAMTPAEQREYYRQREKTTNSRPMKKIRRPTRKIQKRRSRRVTNKKIREVKYDRPFDDNPQLQPAVVVAVRTRRRNLLRKVGYVAPIPSQ